MVSSGPPVPSILAHFFFFFFGNREIAQSDTVRVLKAAISSALCTFHRCVTRPILESSDSHPDPDPLSTHTPCDEAIGTR